MVEAKETILYMVLLRKMRQRSADSFRILLRPQYKDCLAYHEFYQLASWFFHLNKGEIKTLLQELKEMGIITPMKRGFRINVEAIEKMAEKGMKA